MNNGLSAEDLDIIQEAQDYRYENRIIDNLLGIIYRIGRSSQRKYTVKELIAEFKKPENYRQGMHPSEHEGWIFDGWVECARFFGLLEEK